MKKKLVALLLVLTMVLCVFPASAFAAPASTNATIVDKAWSDGKYHMIIYHVEYTVPKGIVLQNDGGSVYRSHTKTAQLKLTEISDDFKQNDIDPQGRDGYFGKNTESAVWAFQNYWNDSMAYWYAAGTVDVDGIIGGQTWSAFSYYMHPQS